MRLYELDDSNYRQMQSYYPVWYRDVREMDSVLNVLGTLLDQMRGQIIRDIDNNFVLTADARTIEWLEHFLRMEREEGATLDERREAIIDLFNPLGHFGQRDIAAIMARYTQSPVHVALIVPGLVQIMVDNADYGDYIGKARSTIAKRIPAHLAFELMDMVGPVETLTESSPELIDINFAFAVFNRTLQTEGYRFNGQKRFDGSIAFDSRYVDSGGIYDVQIGVAVPHTFDNALWLTTSNIRRFDGTYAFDGTIDFNSIFQEEEL